MAASLTMVSTSENAAIGSLANAEDVDGGFSVETSVQRLKKRSDFLALRNGARHSNPYFTVQAKRRTIAGPTMSRPARIGFTVTKKTGNSVVRSRIKRRLRAAAGICDTKGLFQSDTDYAILARRAALSANFSDLTDALARSTSKANAIAQRAKPKNAKPRDNFSKQAS